MHGLAPNFLLPRFARDHECVRTHHNNTQAPQPAAGALPAYLAVCVGGNGPAHLHVRCGGVLWNGPHFAAEKCAFWVTRNLQQAAWYVFVRRGVSWGRLDFSKASGGTEGWGLRPRNVCCRFGWPKAHTCHNLSLNTIARNNTIPMDIFTDRVYIQYQWTDNGSPVEV